MIAEKGSGVSRAEIEAKAKLSSPGGVLTDRLKDLRLAGFITHHISWRKKKGEYYKLIDEFCLFYLKWVAGHRNKIFLPDYWVSQRNKPSYQAWAGYAFESICMKHLDQIVAALKIPSGGIASTWKYKASTPEENGAQIDLLIERNDNAITIFEIKYYQQPFKIDKAYAKNLMNKCDVFRKQTKTKKQIFLVIIAANGLTETMYSEELVSQVLTLDDLFSK